MYIYIGAYMCVYIGLHMTEKISLEGNYQIGISDYPYIRDVEAEVAATLSRWLLVNSLGYWHVWANLCGQTVSLLSVGGPGGGIRSIQTTCVSIWGRVAFPEGRGTGCWTVNTAAAHDNTSQISWFVYKMCVLLQQSRSHMVNCKIKKKPQNTQDIFNFKLLQKLNYYVCQNS